jgi:hypothetical protein
MWNKRDDMIVRNRLPYNAEPPSSVLASSEITPVDAFYVRNHGPFPDIAVEQWQLTVDGLVDKPLTLAYEDLTTNLPPALGDSDASLRGQPARGAGARAADTRQGSLGARCDFDR